MGCTVSSRSAPETALTAKIRALPGGDMLRRIINPEQIANQPEDLMISG
jgi:hypothetical protein